MIQPRPEHFDWVSFTGLLAWRRRLGAHPLGTGTFGHWGRLGAAV